MDTSIHNTFTAAPNALPCAKRQSLQLDDDPSATTERVGGSLAITSAQARVGLFHARRALRRQLSDRLRLSA